jgi:ABC-type transporter Mla subunit MlaD
MSTGKVIRIRLQGLAFLVVLVLLLGLAVASYNKAFTDVARVTLETDTAGNQLQEASDVKVRGVIVGDVREEGQLRGRDHRAGHRPRLPRSDPGRRVGPALAQDPLR